MADEKESPIQKDGDFTWQISEQGNLILDGIEIDRVVHPALVRHNPEEKKELPPDETALVNQGTPQPEPPVEEPKAPEAPVPDEGKRDTPGKQKFKLKVYGEEIEQEFDQSELVNTLQKGVAAEKRFQEVAAKEREIEPFQHIIKTPEFKRWLDERVQAGDIEKPAEPPPPSPEDVMGYRLRSEEPEFDKIRTAMAEWAVTLPKYEAAQLESNHRVFNMAYDRFKNAREQAKPKQEAIPTPTREVAEAVLASKERLKETARAERAGSSPEPPNPAKEAQKRESELRRRMRQGDLNAAVELAAMKYVSDGQLR